LETPSSDRQLLLINKNAIMKFQIFLGVAAEKRQIFMEKLLSQQFFFSFEFGTKINFSLQ